MSLNLHLRLHSKFRFKRIINRRKQKIKIKENGKEPNRAYITPFWPSSRNQRRPAGPFCQSYSRTRTAPACVLATDSVGPTRPPLCVLRPTTSLPCGPPCPGVALYLFSPMTGLAANLPNSITVGRAYRVMRRIALEPGLYGGKGERKHRSRSPHQNHPNGAANPSAQVGEVTV
jgi:hypothetical protein